MNQLILFCLLGIIHFATSSKTGFTYTDPPVTPLNPLTPAEQILTVQIVSSSPQWDTQSPMQFDRFEIIIPSKDIFKSWTPGQPFPRKASVTTYNPNTDKYYLYTINLKNSSYTVEIIPNTRPAWTNTDNNNIVDLLLNSEEYQHVLSQRGISSSQFNNSQVQPYTLLDGRLNPPASLVDMPNLETSGTNGSKPRSWWGTTMLLDQPLTDTTALGNYYVYPVPDVIFWTDANAQKILKIFNGSQIAPMPTESGLMNINYPPNPYASKYRKMQNPIVMDQPKGPSFKFGGISGKDMNTITWHKWLITYDVHEITGLRLFNVKYNDKKSTHGPDNWRNIFYQHNFHEAITTYGSDKYGDRNMNYWDFGEYPYKYFASPLNSDAHGLPPYTTFLNTTFTDETGSSFTIPNSIAMYEVPDGLLWSHYDFWTGVTQGRTHIKFKISFCSTIGNYDYLMTYEFGMDGTIATTAVPTGFDEMAAGTADTLTAKLIHKGIIGANHQHFFGLRTNWDLDGQPNSVYRSDKVPTPDIGDASWTVKNTLIETMGNSSQMEDMNMGRQWLITNMETKDALGHNPSYSIMVDTPGMRLAGDSARISTRTDPMLLDSFFATKYHENQNYFLNTYPVEKTSVDGVIPAQYNESLVRTNIVTWLTMGVNHAPAAEDFPVLPGKMKLVTMFSPSNFFTQNPAMDADIDVVVQSSGPAKCMNHKNNIMRKHNIFNKKWNRRRSHNKN
jgi:primary-amine oxidase